MVVRREGVAPQVEVELNVEITDIVNSFQVSRYLFQQEWRSAEVCKRDCE